MAIPDGNVNVFVAKFRLWPARSSVLICSTVRCAVPSSAASSAPSPCRSTPCMKRPMRRSDPTGRCRTRRAPISSIPATPCHTRRGASRSPRPARCSSASPGATASRASASRRTLVGGERVAVREEIVWQRPFCKLIHFARAIRNQRRPDPKILLVAPMSGHYATLAARHRCRLPAQSRGLHHRLAGRPHGAPVGRAPSISTTISTTSSRCCMRSGRTPTSSASASPRSR